MKLKGIIFYIDELGDNCQKELPDKFVESVEHAIAEMRATGSFHCREGILVPCDVDDADIGSYYFYPPSSIKTIEFVVEE